MPILMFLRQYGLREYAITLGGRRPRRARHRGADQLGRGRLRGCAGGAEDQAGARRRFFARAHHQGLQAGDAEKAAPAPKPVRPPSAPRAQHRARRRRRLHRHLAGPPQLVAVRTPAPHPRLQPVSRRAPAPVVHRPAPVYTPAPAPSRAQAERRRSVQFDDRAERRPAEAACEAPAGRP